MDYLSGKNQSSINDTASKDNAQELNILIRRVGMEDHLNIVKLFQTFGQEKYKFIQFPEIHNNNTTTEISKEGDNNKSNKTSLSLAGLRIDERGGIYLNPLLDTHSAYFKCYVAEDSRVSELVGYILFFNTIMEKGSHTSSTLNTSSSFAHSSSNTSSLQTGNHLANNGSHTNHDDPVAVIEDLYIKTSYRGYGIATQLWRKVLKSSLDRGCFGCECSFLLNNEDGLRFWRQKLGAKKVDTFLPPHHPHHNLSNDSNSSLPASSHAFEDKEEIVIEISRDEMKAYHDEERQDHPPL